MIVCHSLVVSAGLDQPDPRPQLYLIAQFGRDVVEKGQYPLRDARLKGFDDLPIRDEQTMSPFLLQRLPFQGKR